MTVVTRIPPSPTGHFHIGTARTALFNYLFARHEGGRIVYRSEDTDRARSKNEYEQEIMDGLHWLGLDWDEFSRQSDHAARYRELLEKLISEGKAYESDETKNTEALTQPRRDMHEVMSLRNKVIRFKNPGTMITFTDLVRGDITFDTTELGDFVIARSLDDALYHFAVVVDDMDAGVTHVIRGEDHISNTPRQILIQEALGATRPAYAHLPLILDEKRAKLSKRSGATSVMEYRDEGILPEALVNYLALLGWNPGSDREDFSLAELVEAFSLEGIQKSGAAWDREKLLSVNQRWMRKLSDKDFLFALGVLHGLGNNATPEKQLRAVPLLKERARTFVEAKLMLENELRCLFERPTTITHDLLVKKEPEDRKNLTISALQGLLEPLESLQEGVSAEVVKDTIMPLANAEEEKGKGGRGAVLWPLRYALSGQERSPDPFTLIALLGPEESLARVKNAIAILEG